VSEPSNSDSSSRKERLLVVVVVEEEEQKGIESCEIFGFDERRER
jgi:hypothetical protein